MDRIIQSEEAFIYLIQVLSLENGQNRNRVTEINLSTRIVFFINFSPVNSRQFYFVILIFLLIHFYLIFFFNYFESNKYYVQV